MIRKKTFEPSRKNTKKRVALRVVSVTLILLLLGGLYLRFAWGRYCRAAESGALRLAQSIKALLHMEYIEALNDDNLKTLDERTVEQSLVRLVEATDSLYYAYILKQQNGSIVVTADSSAAEPAAFRAARRSCVETAEINRLPFETGQDVLAEPVSAPCGNWIRALVPIYDACNKNIVAALGLSYSAAQWQADLWKKMIPDFVIVINLLALAYALRP